MKKTKAVSFIMAFWIAAAGVTLPAQDQDKLAAGKMSGIKLSENGELLVAEDIKNGAPCGWTLRPGKEYNAGWHILTMESKGENITGADKETHTKIYSGDGKCLSYEETNIVTGDWRAEKLYFHLPETGPVSVMVRGRFACGAAPGKILIRRLSIDDYTPGADKELLPNAFFRESEPGGFPGSWRRRGAEDAALRLIKDPTFKEGLNALEIKNPGRKAVSVRTVNFPLPEKGKLTASVWAKGSGLLKLTLIGGDWKGGIINKSFPLGTEWRQYNAEAETPEHEASRMYFFMASFGGGEHCLAAPSLKLADTRVTSGGTFESRYIGVPCGNLVMNPDFELGWQGWQPRYGQARDAAAAVAQMKKALPEIKECDAPGGGDCLFLSDGNAAESLCMPLKRGADYTVSACVRARGKGQVNLSVIDKKWNAYGKSLQADDTWRRVHFTFKWEKPCYLNEVYIRVRPVNCDAFVDKVQLNEGALTEYSRPPVMLGVMSKCNVFSLNEKTDVVFKAVPSPALKENYSASILLTDESGKKINEINFELAPDKIFTRKLDLPTDKYGLVRIWMTAADKNSRTLGAALGRYAVIPSVPEKKTMLLTNVFPYVFPLEYYRKALPVWTRMGVGGLVVDYLRGYSGAHRNAELLKATKEQLNYYKSVAPELIMRVIEDSAIVPELYFSGSEKGLEMWRDYVRGIVEDYRDSARVYAYLGEVNITSVKPGLADKFKNIVAPPMGTKLIPPEKAFKYFKAASEVTKSVDKTIKVISPSVCGEDMGYVRSFMACGAAKYMDVFGMDAYRTGPDTPETYDDYMSLRTILKENGFDGPVINLEQYFGITPQGYPGAGESGRHYYTPWNEEIHYAGIIARNFIQHAAADVKWSAYLAQTQIYDPFWLEGGFPSMAGPALAAAVKILHNAGSGVKITQGEDIKAFLFPDAPEGPLLAVYSPLKDMSATLKICGLEKAWDFMGNEFEKKIADKGIPLTDRPVYLRFNQGLSTGKIKDFYAGADIRGAGEPFGIKISLTGDNKIRLSLTNRSNKDMAGAARLTRLPDTWKAAETEKSFPVIPSGKSRDVDFAMSRMPFESGGSYSVAAAVSAGDLFSGAERRLSPIFARRMSGFKCDGDFSKWKSAEWTEFSAPGNLVYGGDSGAGDSDFKARLASAWSDEGFAAAVIVDDKEFIPPAAAESAMWQSDSLQIYFDQLSNAAPRRKVYDNDDTVYQIGLLNGIPTAYLEQGPEGRYLGEGNTVQGVDKDVTVSVRSSDGKIFYEMFFPWKTLKFIKPQAGTVFGFSVLVHDRHGKGVRGISLGKESPYKNPSVWKDVILSDLAQ